MPKFILTAIAIFCLANTAQAACTMPVGSYSGGGGGEVFASQGQPLSSPGSPAGAGQIFTVSWPTTTAGGTFTFNAKGSLSPDGAVFLLQPSTVVSSGVIPAVGATGHSWNGTVCKGVVNFTTKAFTRKIYNCSGNPTACPLLKTISSTTANNVQTFAYVVSNSGNVVTLIDQTANFTTPPSLFG